MKSAQYEEIDLPGIQFHRESMRVWKTDLSPGNHNSEENPYESIEGIKAKLGNPQIPEKSDIIDPYAELHQEKSQEVLLLSLGV